MQVPCELTDQLFSTGSRRRGSSVGSSASGNPLEASFRSARSATTKSTRTVSTASSNKTNTNTNTNTNAENPQTAPKSRTKRQQEAARGSSSATATATAMTNHHQPIITPQHQQQHEPDHNHFSEPKTTTKDGQPRSAYDRNAEWYCGDDDDGDGDYELDSVHSDGSSVLSLFRTTKTTKTTTSSNDQYSSTDDGLTEASMNFSDLAITGGGSSNDDDDDEGPSSSFPILQLAGPNPNRSAISDHGISDSLQSISFGQLLLVPETNPSEHDHANNTSSAAVSDIENIERAPEGRDGGVDDIIEATDEQHEKESFLDTISTTFGIRFMAIGSSVFFVIDVTLLWLFLKPPST